MYTLTSIATNPSYLSRSLFVPFNAQFLECLYAQEHPDIITHATVSTDGDLALTASADGMVAVWNLTDGRPGHACVWCCVTVELMNILWQLSDIYSVTSKFMKMRNALHKFTANCVFFISTSTSGCLLSHLTDPNVSSLNVRLFHSHTSRLKPVKKELWLFLTE